MSIRSRILNHGLAQGVEYFIACDYCNKEMNAVEPAVLVSERADNAFVFTLHRRCFKPFEERYKAKEQMRWEELAALDIRTKSETSTKQPGR